MLISLICLNFSKTLTLLKCRAQTLTSRIPRWWVSRNHTYRSPEPTNHCQSAVLNNDVFVFLCGWLCEHFWGEICPVLEKQGSCYINTKMSICNIHNLGGLGVIITLQAYYKFLGFSKNNHLTKSFNLEIHLD